MSPSISQSKRRQRVPPLFMFGFERSGTTLLSMMIGAHPEIAVPLTVTGLWYRYATRLERYGSLDDLQNIQSLVADLLDEERIKLWDVELSLDRLLREPVPRSLAAVVERFHEAYAIEKDKPYWGNLDIATLDEMDEANRWFPNAKFLHIVRDGRDVALSHETMPYGASNTLEAAQRWRQRLKTNLKMGAIVGSERYRVVRYEDLVMESETTLRSICQFFCVDYSPAMMDYPKMVEGKVPQDRMWLWPALDQPPDRSKIMRWSAKMSPTKRIVFEGAAGAMLKELGYETYEVVPKSLRAYAYEVWCFIGRAGRFRRLRSRLGLKRASKLERSWRPKQASTPGALQQDAFGSLVRQGVYREGFEHPPQMRSFFEACVREACGRIESSNGLRILDCGCGPGAWIDVFSGLEPAEHAEFFGFDLTPEMVEVAKSRFRGRIVESHLEEGDILSDASYTFGDSERSYEIVYAFDVVQQLPRTKQFNAILAMLKRVKPGGCAVVFDHDRWSPYGIKMGLRKFATRHLNIALVPEYYCNARYPALAKLGARIATMGGYSIEVKIAPDGKKRALIVWRTRTDVGSHPDAGAG